MEGVARRVSIAVGMCRIVRNQDHASTANISRARDLIRIRKAVYLISDKPSDKMQRHALYPPLTIRVSTSLVINLAISALCRICGNPDV